MWWCIQIVYPVKTVISIETKHHYRKGLRTQQGCEYWGSYTTQHRRTYATNTWCHLLQMISPTVDRNIIKLNEGIGQTTARIKRIGEKPREQSRLVCAIMDFWLEFRMRCGCWTYWIDANAIWIERKFNINDVSNIGIHDYHKFRLIPLRAYILTISSIISIFKTRQFLFYSN